MAKAGQGHALPYENPRCLQLRSVLSARFPVLAAAMASLDQQERFGDFESGELDELLGEGELSIEQEGTLDGEESFRRRRVRRTQLRNQRQ
jgi:hypothetical protein